MATSKWMGGSSKSCSSLPWYIYMYLPCFSLPYLPLPQVGTLVRYLTVLFPFPFLVCAPVRPLLPFPSPNHQSTIHINDFGPSPLRSPLACVPSMFLFSFLCLSVCLSGGDGMHGYMLLEGKAVAVYGVRISGVEFMLRRVSESGGLAFHRM